MAKIYHIQDPAPAMGDREANWLVRWFDSEFTAYIDPEYGSVSAQCVRITRTKLSRARQMINGIETELDRHMISCMELELGRTRADWVDLLVWCRPVYSIGDHNGR